MINQTRRDTFDMENDPRQEQNPYYTDNYNTGDNNPLREPDGPYATGFFNGPDLKYQDKGYGRRA